MCECLCVSVFMRGCLCVSSVPSEVSCWLRGESRENCKAAAARSEAVPFAVQSLMDERLHRHLSQSLLYSVLRLREARLRKAELSLTC